MSTNPTKSRPNSSFRLIASAAIAGQLLCATLLFAQSNPPSAPLPAAVINAQKIFLGNAGGTDDEHCPAAYNGLYAGLKADGHYQLVLDPVGADLVLELHCDSGLPGVSVSPSGPVITSYWYQFRLALIDPHTRTTLWSLSQFLRIERAKDIESPVAKLLADFKALHNGAYSAPLPANGKTRFSQEGTQ